jgi:hypothetical protein
MCSRGGEFDFPQPNHELLLNSYRKINQTFIDISKSTGGIQKADAGETEKGDCSNPSRFATIRLNAFPVRISTPAFACHPSTMAVIDSGILRSRRCHFDAF